MNTNRHNVLIKLKEIEERFPVYSWKYGDLDAWPIIKTLIFFEWNDKFVGNTFEKPIEPREGYAKKVARLFLSIFHLLKLLFIKRQEIEYLFCGANNFRSKEGDVLINRFFYPIILNAKKPYIEIEYTKKNSLPYKDQRKIIFLHNVLPILNLFVRKRKETFDFIAWNDVVKEIKSSLHISLTKKTIINKMQSIKVYIKSFELIFNKLKVETVLGLCYYNNPMFAMHYVANKRGIKNFDVQHGGQGYLHPMYSFAAFPVTGLNTLPQIFWCWDKTSYDHLTSWLGSNSFHSVEVNGNPWISYIIKKYDTFSLPNNIILYTMQYSELDEFVLEAMANTKDYVWWLRLHPRQMHKKADVVEQLRQRALLDRVEIELSNSLPLPLLLSRCKLHLSKFSGSIIEAAQLGVPTIIIDRVGISTYKKYIVEGLATGFDPEVSSDLASVIKEKITK